MGPWLVLVSPFFRENVVATCKIGCFLCIFFGNQISKWRSFEKRDILTFFSHFLVTREKLQKFLQHLFHSHTYTYFAHPIDFFFFFALPILKKIQINQIQLLFGMIPGVDSYSHHFGTINK